MPRNIWNFRVEGDEAFVTINLVEHKVTSKQEASALFHLFDIHKASDEETASWMAASEALLKSSLPRTTEDVLVRLEKHEKAGGICHCILD
jgi:hypothetical protein